MNDTFRLGRIVGVRVGVNWTVLVVFTLLAHELAHAIVARRNGLTVEGITLWLLGGVARFEGEPESPGAELRIAGSGPLVSLLLGIVLAGASAVLLLAGLNGLVAGCLAWLAAINVVLALFNVIP